MHRSHQKKVFRILFVP